VPRLHDKSRASAPPRVIITPFVCIFPLATTLLQLELFECPGERPPRVARRCVANTCFAKCCCVSRYNAFPGTIRSPACHRDSPLCVLPSSVWNHTIPWGVPRLLAGSMSDESFQKAPSVLKHCRLLVAGVFDAGSMRTPELERSNTSQRKRSKRVVVEDLW